MQERVMEAIAGNLPMIAKLVSDYQVNPTKVPVIEQPKL